MLRGDAIAQHDSGRDEAGPLPHQAHPAFAMKLLSGTDATGNCLTEHPKSRPHAEALGSVRCRSGI